MAKRFGIPTGGSMPRGFLTEDGPRPEFAQLDGAVELPTASRAARTVRNVRDADGTLWFGATDTSAAKCALEWCRKVGKTIALVSPEGPALPSHIVEWLRMHDVKVLNVAGNRASKSPAIGERVERFLGEVFHQIGHRPVE